MKRLVMSILVLGLISGMVRADIVYLDNAIENNFIPFGPDGTPGRPMPGDQLGNQITLAGTDRLLQSATVMFALNNSAGNAPARRDTYTMSLYFNDGPLDPNGSGLREPGTLIGTSSVTTTSSSAQNITVRFPFSGLLVPDSFTAVVSSTHPTDTFFQSAGLVGPFSTTQSPTIGTGINTVWYSSTKAGGWEADNSWAINDGATTNFFDMSLDASAIPEPGTCTLLAIGVASLFGFGWLRRR
jgi:hypothetical protein